MFSLDSFTQFLNHLFNCIKLTIVQRFIVPAMLIFSFYTPASAQAVEPEAYQKEMNDWYQKRTDALKAPGGWLNLAGLFWLRKGRNYFGADSANQIVYNTPGFPPVAGYFMLKKGKVQWVSSKGFAVKVDNKPVRRATLYEGNAHTPPLASWQSLRWSIIKRDSLLGVRLRDLDHPAVVNFSKIDRYPLDTSWRIHARFEAKENDSLRITNMIGQTYKQKSPGRLHFTIAGSAYTLDALENTGDDLFIIFADATNGLETYGSGRYMYIPKADANGNIILDFNKAINPPCVFTAFATCPVPPRQNRLPLNIEAGEKIYRTGF
jgi:uncharacterized protein (DUF1684 family)